MVHFHIHTNGVDEEEGVGGRRRVVNPWIIRAVWAGLAFLLWVAAAFIIIKAIQNIEIL